MRNAYAFGKIYGIELPHKFFFSKIRCSVIGNNCLEYRTNNSTFLRDEMFFIHYLLQRKPNLYSVVTQFIVKVYRKVTNSPIF